MPGSTKVTDIIGEANYFGINLIGNNPQISGVNYVESKGYIDFSVFPNKHCYITENEDFARYISEQMELHVDETIGNLGDKTIAEIEDQYADSDDSDSDVSINEIDKRSLGHIISDLMVKDNDVVCEYYEEYYDITYDNIYNDSKDFELREMPEGKNIYMDVVTDDYPNDPYGENSNIPDLNISAKVILKGSFSETIDGTSIVEWKVTHTKTGWSETYMGDVKTRGNMFVQLPYLGNYDVEMTVWDVYNHCSKKQVKDAIVVEPYNIDIRGFYYDARPLPDGLNYDLLIPHEYDVDDNEKMYHYYLWAKKEGNETKGIVTIQRNPKEVIISDIQGEYIIDGGVDDYSDPKHMRDIDREHWISVVNTENDSNDVLKLAWIYNDGSTTSYGVDEFNFVEELIEPSYSANDSYVPEWNSDALYHVIKKNVDKMLSWALQEHLKKDCVNTSMRNYRPDGSVNFKGPYYKYDVDTIVYRANLGYKEYDHLNGEIVNLEPGKHYKYVRYINSVVDIKPLTWVILGFDYTRITGRIINNEYPMWTLIMVGDELDPDEDFREDKIIATHNGLYFTYLFENEGSYKIKLEMKDLNGNMYEIEKYIVIVDKDANYKMYHTLNDAYNTYLEERRERLAVYKNT